ncbi:MFS general substrate transporter [Hysterangium stoloniferum]|nr:MFS general substrate transporter [Hysterangium stoloniferum]
MSSDVVEKTDSNIGTTLSPEPSIRDVADINPIEEKRLLRKIDFVILPLFTLLYATNFVDRTAVGNARIAGLEADLRLTGFEYNIALTLFYVTFSLVEIPSNLILKRFGSVWLAILIILFGMVAISTAFIQSFTGLIITRLVLGMTEGGLLPGLIYLMSRYYRRKERVLRMGIFFGCSPSLAGAFGGLLASGLLYINPIGSVTSWRKIFLVEGIITIGLGILCLFFLPDDPETSRLLTKEERLLALKRIAFDNPEHKFKRERTKMQLVLRSLNFNACLTTFAFILTNISFQGLSLFMPTVIATLGHFTTVQIQLRTVPPFLVAAAWAVCIAYASYSLKQRGLLIAFSLLFTITGYSIFVGTDNSHARYGACFLAVGGVGCVGPLLLAWATDNAAPDTVRAVTTAMVPGVGALGAIISVWTYLPDDAPNYHRANSVNLAASCLAFVLVLIGLQYVHWENRKRERGERDIRLIGRSQEEVDELGAYHPAYRYQP